MKEVLARRHAPARSVVARRSFDEAIQNSSVDALWIASRPSVRPTAVTKSAISGEDLNVYMVSMLSHRFSVAPMMDWSESSSFSTR
ncbi:hypothetical protein QA641_27415 [Bradyrhizobium sp. CB1650]|uniref:hypothetical protein n=1 Tax=Bradyrhizobium sp. CB1650 TaxID=3039153 RepID=UPI0024351DD3|nr:hypothetical protein [Bradyrhizobium sp. CB1650]WGD49357.1 hypothetical protein QA641_27415 [Bradyrhizobium sp. CB1650]